MEGIYGLRRFINEYNRQINPDFSYESLNPLLKELILAMDDRRWVSYFSLDVVHSLNTLPGGNSLGGNPAVDDIATVLKYLTDNDDITLHSINDVLSSIYLLVKNSNYDHRNNGFIDENVLKGYLSQVFSFEHRHVKEGYAVYDFLFYMARVHLLGQVFIPVKKYEFKGKEMIQAQENEEKITQILMERVSSGEEYGKKVFEVLTFLHDLERSYVEKGYGMYRNYATMKLEDFLELLNFEDYRKLIDILHIIKNKVPKHILDVSEMSEYGRRQTSDIFTYLINIERYLERISTKEKRSAFITSLVGILEDETSQDDVPARFLFTYYMLKNHYRYLINRVLTPGSEGEGEVKDFEDVVARFLKEWYGYARINGLRVDEASNIALSSSKKLNMLALPHEKPLENKFYGMVRKLKNIFGF